MGRLRPTGPAGNPRAGIFCARRRRRRGSGRASLEELLRISRALRRQDRGRPVDHTAGGRPVRSWLRGSGLRRAFAVRRGAGSRGACAPGRRARRVRFAGRARDFSMNVLVLGGGPGGLYSAILLQKSHPRWRIRVVERNPPDATYGWGIVFSDRTLGSFREADSKTYLEITDRFVPWDTVEVRVAGSVVRCGGNVFAG